MRRAPHTPARKREGEARAAGRGWAAPAVPCVYHPADLFAEAELIAACRRTAAICDRAAIALIPLALALIAGPLLKGWLS